MGEPARSRRPYAIAAAIVAAAVAAALGMIVGYQLHDDSPAAARPNGDSVDAGFARDMSVHHAQAVEMSMIVRDATDNQAVRTLAYDIATTQQQQIGQMYAWLELWGLPQHSSEPVMAWMGGSMSSGDTGEDMDGMVDSSGEQPLMMGMATPAQMDQLRAASGKRAEVRFLQMMIRHHQGGVEMAQYAVDHAAVEQVRHLAEAMVTAQESEIKAMNDMLVERGAKPIR